MSVSQATRPAGSSPRTASSTESETWSAILSGWPSVTDSDVNRNSRAAIGAAGYLLDRKERRELQVLRLAARGEYEGAERLEVAHHLGRDLLAGDPGEALDERRELLDVEIDEAEGRIAHVRVLGRLLERRVVGQAVAALAHVGDRARPGRHDRPAVEGRVRDREVVDDDLLR